MATIASLGVIATVAGNAAAAEQIVTASPDAIESVTEPATPPIPAGQTSSWDGKSPPGPAPAGYQWRLLPQYSLVTPGIIVFGIGYGLTILDMRLGAEKGRDIQVGWLLLPIVGPSMAVATQHETCKIEYSPPRCGRSVGTIRAMAFLTAVQLVGAGLFAWGELDRKWQLERLEWGSVSVLPGPMGQSGYGLSALGHF